MQLLVNSLLKTVALKHPNLFKPSCLVVDVGLLQVVRHFFITLHDDLLVGVLQAEGNPPPRGPNVTHDIFARAALEPFPTAISK